VASGGRQAGQSGGYPRVVAANVSPCCDIRAIRVIRGPKAVRSQPSVVQGANVAITAHGRSIRPAALSVVALNLRDPIAEPLIHSSVHLQPPRSQLLRYLCSLLFKKELAGLPCDIPVPFPTSAQPPRRWLSRLLVCRSPVALSAGHWSLVTGHWALGTAFTAAMPTPHAARDTTPPSHIPER
jgi:hypothetical protein